MPPRESAPVEMPAVAPDFAERLTHTDPEVMASISLFDVANTSDKYIDPRGYLKCEVGPKNGQFKNFQLMQRNGAWTEPISTINELPLLYREYVYHLSRLMQKESVKRSGDDPRKAVLSRGRDVASTMNFSSFLTPQLLNTGAVYAEEMKFPGHVAICDGNRQMELYLDEGTLTPAFARVRLHDGFLSPPFVFSLLPAQWQTQAQRFFSGISQDNVAERIAAPERQKPFDVEALKATIARCRDAVRSVILFGGPSGVGKDTVLQRVIEYLQEHGIDAPIMKTLSRVTSRPQRPDESPDDNNYVTEDIFYDMAAAQSIINPYKTRDDDMYGYKLDVLLKELQSSTVALTIANSGQYLGVYEEIRARIAAIGLSEPLVVWIDKDRQQMYVSINGRNADEVQKAQRKQTVGEFLDRFRCDYAQSLQGGDGPVLHPLINNYMMYDDSVERFLEIWMSHMNALPQK